MSKGAKTILDVVVESVPQSRNVTLKKKIQQLQRVGDMASKKFDRRSKKYYQDESGELLSRDVDEASDFFVDVERAIDGLSVDNTRYIKKCFDDIAWGRRPRDNCFKEWYTKDWLKHLSKDTKDAIKNIEIDPLMYTDSKSDFISNYAKKLISGEYD